MEKKTILLLCFLYILIATPSCNFVKEDETKINSLEESQFENQLILELTDDNSLKIGKSIDFFVTNNIDELIVFPHNSNMKVYWLNEKENIWEQAELGEIIISSPNDYIGLQPGYPTFLVAPVKLENKGEPIKVLITIEGNIYRGNMEEFEESGITDEVVKGSLEIVLQP